MERQALPIVEAAQYLGADRLLVIPGFFQEGDSPEEREAQLEGWWKVSTGWRTWPRATASLW